MAMTTDQIFKLLDAGYTKDEIMSLDKEPEQPKKEPEPKPETKNEPPAKQDPPEKNKPETNTEPEQTEESDEVKKLKAQIAELQKEAAKNAKQIEPEKKLNSEGVIKSFFDRL